MNFKVINGDISYEEVVNAVGPDNADTYMKVLRQKLETISRYMAKFNLLNIAPPIVIDIVEIKH